MASELQFERLCQVFEKVFALKKNKPEQYKILTNFISELKCEFAASRKGCNLFPILRLILPDLERERSAYNLKEVKLGQLLVKAMSLAKTSPDGQKLLNFRAVKNNSEGSDFPSVAYFVHNNRVRRAQGNLTIGDVNAYLDKISEAEVGNKGPILDEVFTKVLKSTTAKQAKWFLRIVLKDMKLGMGKYRILSAFHPDAPEYYDTCTSLSKVCEDLDESNTRPAELGVELFSAVSPMLSERLDVTRARDLPSDRTYEIEIKFDGERFQMHMQDNEFEFFSRRGFKYSERFGRTFQSEGFLTPLLEGAFNPSIRSFVLDGEMMGWHKEHQRFGSKGQSFDIKKIVETSKYRPCFCVFDILYYNGKSLVGTPDKGGVPLTERLRILDKLFVDIPGVIIHSQRKIVNDLGKILDELNTARENNEEGIVVKDCDSYYIANKRNAGWYKIKPEYTEGAMEDLDLVVIGADYAENKRVGLAKSFVVACIEKNDEDVSNSHWLAVGRVSTGLSFDELERVCNTLSVHWQRTAHHAPPSCLRFNKVKPDLWVLPKHSLVFTVRATELIRSTDFAIDYTLRFPRIVKLRDDKPIVDITTVQELKSLYENKGSVAKLSTKNIGQSDIDLQAAAAKRKRAAKPLEFADNFVTKTKNVEVTSQALKGRKICILSHDDDCSKEDLERIVLSHGGTVVPNIGSNTWCCIAGRPVMRVRNVIESQQSDVVSTAWLRSLPHSTTPAPGPDPLDMISITNATRLKLSRDYDKFGDNYTEPTDVATLMRVFDKMERDNEPENHLTTKEIMELDLELFPEGNLNSFLRPCAIYLKDATSILAMRCRMFGAKVCQNVNAHLSHYVVTSETDEEMSACKEKLNNECIIVTQRWLDKCISEKNLVSEDDYVL